MDTLEDMSLPCPMDVCDGSGKIGDGEDGERDCPHTSDGEPDRDEEE